MKQLSSIQAARGIAAWMVVAYHMLAIEKKYVSAALLPEIFAKGMLGVDVFFVISGFVMVHSTMGSPRGLPSAYHFLARRVIRVYPPYWFYSLLLVPVFLVAPQIINSAQGNDVSLLNSFLLLPDTRLPLLPVGWSLVYEMWFYLVFAFFLLFPPRAVAIFLVIWAVHVLFWFSEEASSPSRQLVTSPFTLEFIAGSAGALLFQRWGWASAVVSLAVGVVGLFVVFGAVPEIINAVSVQRAAILGICISAVLSGACALERGGLLSGSSVGRWSGDVSYSLYLSHILVLSFVGRIWFAATTGFNHGVLGALVFWIVAVFTVGIVAHLSFRFLELPILAAFRKTYFRREPRTVGSH